MAANDADSIPAIAEQDARGDIASLYEDLRLTLGVPFVNLIWRHLATIPGGLAMVWTLLKPLYVSSELDRLSAETSALVSLPSLARLPDEVWDNLAISADDRQTIATLIENYNHANGVNFLALLTAVSVLNDGLPAASINEPPPGANRHRPPARVPPPLPGLSELPLHTLGLVRQIDQLGRLGSSEAIASLYRHLAHWPAFLSLAYATLAPLHRSGVLADIQEDVIQFGRQQTAELARWVDRTPPAISPDGRRLVLRVLDEFTRLMIGRMIVTGTAMRLLVSS